MVKIPVSKEYRRFMKNSYVQLDEVTELVGDTVLTKFLYARQLCGQYSPDKIQAVIDLTASTDERIVIFYNFNVDRAAPVCASSVPHFCIRSRSVFYIRLLDLRPILFRYMYSRMHPC